MKIHHLPNGRIHEGDWLHADLEPGYALAIVDGPYGMGKAGWDRVKVADLADWYAPHIERLTSLMADSATVYLWNTAEGWARLDPVMRAAGWTFAGLIVWDKMNTPASMSWQKANKWPTTHEVCCHYERGAAVCAPTFSRSVWPAAIQSYADERLLSGRVLRGSRNQFGAPCSIAEALHPCQKPIAFAERMIRASSRPGERVLVPFGGTNREAVAIEWMARRDPAEARQYDACELNQDPGRDYIAPVLAQIRGQDHRPGAHRQAPLFGGAA